MRKNKNFETCAIFSRGKENFKSMERVGSLKDFRSLTGMGFSLREKKDSLDRIQNGSFTGGK